MHKTVPVEDVESAFDPHRHDSYGLFLLRSGELTLLVEERVVHIQGSSLLLVQPRQVHQCVHSNEISGWVMFLDGNSLDTNTKTVTEQSIKKIALFDSSSLSQTELSQTEAGVDVTFASGSMESFDLAISAEGIGSSTRKLAFSQQPAFKYLGLYTVPPGGQNRTYVRDSRDFILLPPKKPFAL